MRWNAFVARLKECAAAALEAQAAGFEAKAERRGSSVEAAPPAARAASLRALAKVKRCEADRARAGPDDQATAAALRDAEAALSAAVAARVETTPSL